MVKAVSGRASDDACAATQVPQEGKPEDADPPLNPECEWDYCVRIQPAPDVMTQCISRCSLCWIDPDDTRETPIPCFERRIGLMHAFRGKQPFGCVAGPCWPMSAIMIVVHLLAPAVVLSKCGSSSTHVVYTAVLVVLWVLALGCYLATACR